MLITMTACSSSGKEDTSQRTATTEKAEEKPVYDPDASCTIFIYMCGSNLESKQGLAGKDIDELLSADIPENVNVVIETGGAKKWRSHGIANNKIQRYIVKDHELVLVDEQENKSMGSSESLLEWIRWAAENYPGERNVLVMWDHGGDPTEGICYDENYSYSGLKQSELSTMFHENGLTTETIREKYPKVDMVIFDTCFMGNIETVSWLKNYYHYMIASEVIMPGGGLDYKVIAEEFSKNDDETFGKIVCDSFMAECEEKGQSEKTELSLYDLSQAEEAISVLEDVFEKELKERREYFANLTPQELSLLSFKELLTFSAKSNAVVEGSKDFNLIDLKNFIEDECSDPDDRERARAALEKLICYQVGNVPDYTMPENDPDYGRSRCTGLSVYYPFKFDKDKLTQYLGICPIKNYAGMLENIYLKQKDMSLSFADSGSINENGKFEITLTDESKPYFDYLIGKLWKEDTDGSTYHLLGEQTFSLSEEQKTLTFYDLFTGVWYHLNGYPLSGTGVWENGSELFHAKIKRNGENTLYNFSSKYDFENAPVISQGYIGEQFDENGLVNRNYEPLEKGDVITVMNDNEEIGEFTVESADLTPQLQMLEPGRYRFQFTAVALDNSFINSDYVISEVTESGAKAAEIIKAD